MTGRGAFAILALAAAGCSEGAPAKPAPAATPVAVAGAATVKLCEHGVPADECTKCDPTLAATFHELGDWCEIHGLPKSHDKICNPGLTFTAPVAKDWCKEHAVPESKCTKCKPALIAGFIQAGDYCREHGYPASVCPYHHPELVRQAGEEPPVFPEPGTRIRLASAETAREAGIETVRAAMRPFSRTIDVVGEMGFDQNHLTQVSARGDAVVIQVRVDVGEDVRAGQALVVLASGTVGADQAHLLSARARVETAQAALIREDSLLKQGFSSQRDVEQAKSELAAATADEQTARASLGAAGAEEGSDGGRYTLAAPFAGTVVRRDVVGGRAVTAGQTLLDIADLSRMWATLEVPEESAAQVRPGQRVTISIEALPDATFEAKIDRVAPTFDPRTRTVQVRVELPNPERVLKAGTFLKARIHVTEKKDALMIPRESIQRAEGRSIVFVRTGEGIYEPKAVELGGSDERAVEILKGIEAGAEVATTGAFLLKTEILKDSIGAGCCEVEEK